MLLPYSTWSGALDSSDLLLSCFVKSSALHITTILVLTHLSTPKSSKSNQHRYGNYAHWIGDFLADAGKVFVPQSICSGSGSPSGHEGGSALESQSRAMAGVSRTLVDKQGEHEEKLGRKNKKGDLKVSGRRLEAGSTGDVPPVGAGSETNNANGAAGKSKSKIKGSISPYCWLLVSCGVLH